MNKQNREIAFFVADALIAVLLIAWALGYFNPVQQAIIGQASDASIPYGQSATFTAYSDLAPGDLVYWVWYVDGTQVFNEGAVQTAYSTLPNLPVGQHTIRVESYSGESYDWTLTVTSIGASPTPNPTATHPTASFPISLPDVSTSQGQMTVAVILLLVGGAVVLVVGRRKKR